MLGIFPKCTWPDLGIICVKVCSQYSSPRPASEILTSVAPDIPDSWECLTLTTSVNNMFLSLSIQGLNRNGYQMKVKKKKALYCWTCFRSCTIVYCVIQSLGKKNTVSYGTRCSIFHVYYVTSCYLWSVGSLSKIWMGESSFNQDHWSCPNE